MINGRKGVVLIMANYTSILKSRSFLYLEFKKAVSLLLQEISWDEIKAKSLEENLFQLSTESRILEVYNAVSKRAMALDEFLLKQVVEGDLETSRQIALYSILKTDRLFLEFMRDVYTAKLRIKDYRLMNKDFSLFFQEKAEQAENMKSWGDRTLSQLQQVYTKILIEAGFAKKEGGHIVLNHPIIQEQILEHLHNKGGREELFALFGEVYKCHDNIR